VPNHCSNALTTTNPKIVAILRDCEERGDENFINAIYPMPLELKGTLTGSAKAPDGTIVRLWREGPDKEVIPVTDDEQERLVKVYGATNWYDWSVKNLGTKWGAYSTSYHFTNDEAIVTFDTAWSPPSAFLDKITRIYPQGRTRLAYSEGGMGYWGVDVYVDGELVEEKFSDSGFWSDELDEDECSLLSPEVQEHLNKYGLHSGG